MNSSPFLSWRKWGSKKQIFRELSFGGTLMVRSCYMCQVGKEDALKTDGHIISERPRIWNTEESAFQHLWVLALCCPLVLFGPPICLFPTTLRYIKLMDPLGVSWHPQPGGSHTENAQRHRFPCRKKQVSGRKEKLQCFSPAL